MGPSVRLPGVTIAALASIGAGLIHGGAIGLHAEHPQAARLFIVVALAQVVWGLTALLRPNRAILPAGVVVNGLAVGGWIVTRLSGISWIDGLEQRESPQWADSLCAGLGVVAAAAAATAFVLGTHRLPPVRLAFPSAAIGAVVLVGLWTGASHVHDHAPMFDAAGNPIDESQPHGHDGDDHSEAANWPRPWDPARGIDISGVAGVTIEQEMRARTLIEDSLELLPQWADHREAVDQGWLSIGDASTGFEHFINRALIDDDKFLDPSAPESLVYRVDGSERTLVSAMFIAQGGIPLDDPELTSFAGPLIQWHAHDNLCWKLNEQGNAVIAGITDDSGTCPPGSIRAGQQNAMVHVWISPHACGPFAALEGVGAGRADVSDAERVDMCHSDHGHGSDGSALASIDDSGASRIDLSGYPGVSPEEQARAERLIYITREVLPKFSTPEIAVANGFTSIGDAATGVEHFINWSYVNDEYELDPNFPESLVFAVEPDGSRRLVSAMYMLGDQYDLETVPNVGGVLTQWHIHDNLCFDRDPMVHGSTRVVGVTTSGGPCRFGIKLRPNPMLHVWLEPQVCGPFAALEGIGAGQVKPGEEHLCNSLHSHT